MQRPMVQIKFCIDLPADEIEVDIIHPTLRSF